MPDIDPVEEQFKLKMNVVRSALDDVFNGIGAKMGKRNVGFVLMVYDNEQMHHVNFISNGANQHEILELLKKQVELLEEALNGS